MDKCHTATYIDEFIPYLPTPPIPTNPLSTSCLLAPFVADSYKSCSINTGSGSHHVAFMNDDIQTPPYPCFSSDARTAVKMAPLTSPSPRFESSPVNSIEVLCIMHIYLKSFLLDCFWYILGICNSSSIASCRTDFAMHRIGMLP